MRDANIKHRTDHQEFTTRTSSHVDGKDKAVLRLHFYCVGDTDESMEQLLT
jgi:hypothetical protein